MSSLGSSPFNLQDNLLNIYKYTKQEVHNCSSIQPKSTSTRSVIKLVVKRSLVELINAARQQLSK